MTTVAAFGQYDAELMCYAHSKGARLVLKGKVRLDIISKFSVFYKHDVTCISNQTRFTFSQKPVALFLAKSTTKMLGYCGLLPGLCYVVVIVL